MWTIDSVTFTHLPFSIFHFPFAICKSSGPFFHFSFFVFLFPWSHHPTPSLPGSRRSYAVAAGAGVTSTPAQPPRYPSPSVTAWNVAKPQAPLFSPSASSITQPCSFAVPFPAPKLRSRLNLRTYPFTGPRLPFALRATTAVLHCSCGTIVGRMARAL